VHFLYLPAVHTYTTGTNTSWEHSCVIFTLIDCGFYFQVWAICLCRKKLQFGYQCELVKSSCGVHDMVLYLATVSRKYSIFIILIFLPFEYLNDWKGIHMMNHGIFYYWTWNSEEFGGNLKLTEISKCPCNIIKNLQKLCKFWKLERSGL